jgi:hypothetical protein
MRVKIQFNLYHCTYWYPIMAPAVQEFHAQQA